MRLVPFIALLLAGRAAAADYGVLLLAHGGDARWNATVRDIRDALDARAPTELALGMSDLAALQQGVELLQKRGSRSIRVIPLFIHSRSEVLDQTRYALGLTDQPSSVFRDAVAAMSKIHVGHHAMSFSLERVKTPLPISIAPALDDSPLVSDIVRRRALALSRNPARETLVLVGHGPVDGAANEAWLAAMRLHAARARAALGLKDARALTLRDDAPPDVRAPAVAALREAVESAGRDGGRALVVPYLIARGGIEQKIGEALSGLRYGWNGRTLCPDPAVERLLAERVAALVGK